MTTQPLIVTSTQEGDRLYSWKDHTYPSVTSVIRYGVAKPNLVPWAANKVLDLAVLMREEVSVLKKTKARKTLKDAWELERDIAADRGTAIHEAAEQYALGKAVDMVPEIEPYVKAFDSFCYDFKPEFMYTEALVVSHTYGYAGTLDSIVRIDGKTYVLDIKTGNYVWPEVALQLSAYARADFIGDRTSGKESSLPPLYKRGLVLHLQPDGYKLYPVRLGDTEFNSFLAAMDMYHWSTEISKSAILPAWVKSNEALA
jgi:hypothetical protein